MSAELVQILRMLAALAFVIALMGGLALILKRLGYGTAGNPGPGKTKRLKIVEALTLDARRRLVLVQRDDKQHLVILGPGGETVVETGIGVVAAKPDLESHENP